MNYFNKLFLFVCIFVGALFIWTAAASAEECENDVATVFDFVQENKDAKISFIVQKDTLEFIFLSDYLFSISQGMPLEDMRKITEIYVYTWPKDRRYFTASMHDGQCVNGFMVINEAAYRKIEVLFGITGDDL